MPAQRSGTDDAEVSDADAARFERLLREHGAALERLTALYARGAGDRQDLMQEIAFAIWRALPRFRGESSERTFVYRIAHNRALSFRWRNRRHDVPLEQAPEPADPAPDPERLADSADQRSRLEQAVRSLPIPLRQCVVLRFEGLRDAEISEIVGISVGNVAVRLTRARRRLRELLAEAES
jgi:RNA polymerase sigma-70 factor (ECF subfamily)